MLKACFPEKIDQRGKRRGRGYAMIVVFKMVVMEEFNMPQASKLKKDSRGLYKKRRPPYDDLSFSEYLLDVLNGLL
jgi:hypothetical protein